MPFYRAIAQNTLRFSSDVTVDSVGDITKPGTANIGKVKVIVDDSEVQYVMPHGGYYTESSTVPTFTYLPANSSYTDGIYRNSTNYQQVYTANDGHICMPRGSSGSVIVDGYTLHGLRNSNFSMMLDCGWCGNAPHEYLISKHYLPACNCRVIIHEFATASGVNMREYVMSSLTLSPIRIENSSSVNAYNYARHLVNFYIPKSSQDVILSMSFEYPKYDVALTSEVSGLQYSLDDGFTFEDAPAGLVLEQVEHTIFKNTNTDKSVYIWDSTGVIQEIPAEATRVVVPTEDTAWSFTYYNSGSNPNA